MKIWVNDRLFEQEDARISVLDHGFTVGDGVFETIKTVDNQPFALCRHLNRLRHSATGLLLPAPDDDVVKSAISQVIAANPVAQEGRLRITWTAGVGPNGSGRDPLAQPTLVITHVLATAWPETARIVTVDFPRNERSPLTGLKTISYAENVLALAEAKSRSADEAIFGNTRGELCEGTGSNVFVIIGGELLTPPLSSGCLAGITRALALEWCGARELTMPLAVLMEADEILLASSTRDLQSVHQVNDRLMPTPTDLGKQARSTFAKQSRVRLDP